MALCTVLLGVPCYPFADAPPGIKLQELLCAGMVENALGLCGHPRLPGGMARRGAVGGRS